MNYTFGVEFVEVDRLYTGDERIQMKTPELTQGLEQWPLTIDREKWNVNSRGVMGSS